MRCSGLMRGAKLAAQRLIPTGPRRTEPRSGIRLLAERAYRLAQELCAVRYASDGTAHDRPWQSRRGNASAASGCASLLAVITTSRSAGAAGGGGPSGGVQGGAERLSSSSDWQMRLRIGGGVTSNVANICDSHAQACSHAHACSHAQACSHARCNSAMPGDCRSRCRKIEGTATGGHE